WPLYRPLFGDVLKIKSKADRAYVVEGEKAADALGTLGLDAWTSAHGAKAPHKTDWRRLAEMEVVLCPDNDAAGRAYARAVAGLCRQVGAASVKVLELSYPGRQDGDDAVEWVGHYRRKGKTKAQLRKRIEWLADKAPEYEPEVEQGPMELGARGADPRP